jgi:hypothetical protein
MTLLTFQSIEPLQRTRVSGLRAVPLVACALLFGAWDEKNWGDLAATFVDTEIHGLSATIADAELNQRWEKSTRLFYVGLLGQLLVYDVALVKIDIPAAPASDANSDDLKTFILDLHARLRNLTALETELAWSAHLLDTSRSTCVAESVFSALNFDGILRFGILAISLPTPNYSFGLTSDGYTGFVNMFSAGLIADKVSDQNDKFNDALERLPDRLISRPELFQLSKTICAALRTPYGDYAAAIRATLDKQVSYIQTLRAVLNSLRVGPEQRFMALVTNQVLSQGGLPDLFASLDSESVDAQLLLETVDIRSTVETRLNAIKDGDCIHQLASTEDLDDYIQEGLLQSKAVAATAGQEVAQAATSLTAYLADASTKLKAAREGAIAGTCE